MVWKTSSSKAGVLRTMNSENSSKITNLLVQKIYNYTMQKNEIKTNTWWKEQQKANGQRISSVHLMVELGYSSHLLFAVLSTMCLFLSHFLHCEKYIIFCTDKFVNSKNFHCSWSVKVPPLRNLFFHTRIVYSPQIVILRSSAHVSLLIGTLGTF